MKRNSSYKVKKLQEGGDILDLPQKKLMKEIFGKYEKPSELMNGREWGSKLMGQENYGLLADLLLDPLNIIPLSKAKYFKNIQGIDKIPLNKLQQIGNTIWGLDKLDDINDIHNIKNSSKNYKSDYTPHITPKYNLGGTININNMRKKNKKRYQTGGNINMGNLLGFLPYLNTMMTGNGDIDSLINPTTGGQSGFMGSIGNITNMNKRNYSDQAHDYLMQATSKPYAGFQKGGGVPDPTLVDILDSLNLLNSSGNYAYAGKYPKGSPSNIIGTDINKLLYNNKKPKLTKKVVDAIKLNKLDQKIINAQLPEEKTKAYLDEMSTMGKPSLSNILDYKDLYGKVKKDLKITSKEAKSVADSLLEDKSFMERAAIKATIYPFLQRGGVINSTGYTPGTSSMANSMNIIPGGNITMKNTPFPVLGIPSNGVPRIMQPGQDYKFGGASHVTEFPLRLQGGDVPEYGFGDWIGKQWKGVKKTVGHLGKEIGKVANDFAVGSADMIGNTTGLWDISKNSYKTGIGQQIQGPMNNIGGMLGSAAWGSLGLSQPGVAQGMRQNDAYNQQPMNTTQPQSGNTGDLSALLQILPMLLQGMNQKDQSQSQQYRYGLPYQAQQGGIIQPTGDPYEYQDNGDGTFSTRKRGSNRWIKVSKGEAYDAIKTKIYPGQTTNDFSVTDSQNGEMSVYKKNPAFTGFTMLPLSPSAANQKNRWKPSNQSKYEYEKSIMDKESTWRPLERDLGLDPLYRPRKYQQGGSVELSPIQTEKGEMLIWPTYDITNVKATKLHKHMDEGHVTDLVPGGAGVYVASNYKPLTVKKDEVDFILGMGRVEYDENMNRKVQPKEVNFNEVFNNKKKLTPAQIAKNISKKYGITDREDSFADRANSENKESRAPYLEILRTVNDLKREGGAPQFQQGGQVPQYGLGDFIGPILNTIMGGIQFQDNTNNRRRGERDAVEYYKLANSNLNKGTQFGTAAAVGSALSQDPYVNRPDRSIQEATIRDTLDRTPSYIRNATTSQINRPLSIMKDSAFRNSTNFGRSTSALQNTYAQTLGAISQSALQYGSQDIGLRNNYLANIANLKGQMAQEFANQQNQIRTNKNTIFGNLFGNVGNLGINHYNQDSALLANKYNMKAAARGQQTAANAALVQNTSNSLNMIDWSKLNPQAPVQTQPTYQGYVPYVVPTPAPQIQWPGGSYPRPGLNPVVPYNDPTYGGYIPLENTVPNYGGYIPGGG